MTGIKISLTAFYLLLAAIGAWWMIYLTRPAVKTPIPDGRRAGNTFAAPAQHFHHRVDLSLAHASRPSTSCFGFLYWSLAKSSPDGQPPYACFCSVPWD
jgi:hypothetical protein